MQGRQEQVDCVDEGSDGEHPISNTQLCLLAEEEALTSNQVLSTFLEQETEDVTLFGVEEASNISSCSALIMHENIIAQCTQCFCLLSTTFCIFQHVIYMLNGLYNLICCSYSNSI